MSIDFGDVGYINSTGIALIVRLLTHARRDGRAVLALGLTEHYREIFRNHAAVRLHGDRRGRSRMTSTSVALDRDGPTAILRITGDITSASEPELMEAYIAAGVDTHVVILDFSRLDYMNSGGIGLLVTMLVRAQRHGRRLLAIGLSEHYREIFSLTRLDEAIDVYETEADARTAAISRR